MIKFSFTNGAEKQFSHERKAYAYMIENGCAIASYKRLISDFDRLKSVVFSIVKASLYLGITAADVFQIAKMQAIKSDSLKRDIEYCLLSLVEDGKVIQGAGFFGTTYTAKCEV